MHLRLFKFSKFVQGIPGVLCWRPFGACALVFFWFVFNTHYDWKKKKNQWQLGKEKKGPLGFGTKTTFFFVFSLFSLWKWFLVKLKKKPCSVTPQERAYQYPGKFHADDNLLFCSTCNVVVDHHRKSVLDNQLSAVSHIKRMNESFPLGAKQQTLKISFKSKTPAQEEKWKSAMSG